MGGSIHLPCLYTTAKDHNVEIDWFKGRGHNVRNSEGRAKGRISIRKNHLEFNNVWLEDAGNYSCRVKMWQMEEYDSITYSVKVEREFRKRTLNQKLSFASAVSTTRMRAKRVSEFRKIPQNSAKLRKVPQNTADFRRMYGILRSFAEFCGTLRNFSKFFGILRNWRFGTVCSDLESSSFSLNFCNVL